MKSPPPEMASGGGLERVKNFLNSICACGRKLCEVFSTGYAGTSSQRFSFLTYFQSSVSSSGSQQPSGNVL